MVFKDCLRITGLLCSHLSYWIIRSQTIRTVFALGRLPLNFVGGVDLARVFFVAWNNFGAVCRFLSSVRSSLFLAFVVNAGGREAAAAG